MIKSVNEKRKIPIELDLTGPDGNAYVLLGLVRGFAEAIGIDPEPIREDMQSGDYEHLVDVFDREFGHFVTLYR